MLKEAFAFAPVSLGSGPCATAGATDTRIAAASLYPRLFGVYPEGQGGLARSREVGALQPRESACPGEQEPAHAA